MVKRVMLEDWQLIVPYICFGLISLSFLVIVFKAALLSRKEADRLSRLPLQSDQAKKKEVNHG